MPAKIIGFRIWSASQAIPSLKELAARQESVTGLRCAFAVHERDPLGWVEMSAVPSVSPATACRLTRSSDRSKVLSLMRDLRPTRTDLVHSLRMSKTAYFTGTEAGHTDFTLLLQLGLTWALAQITRGLIAGDTPSGEMEYWWSDAFLSHVERLRARVEAEGKGHPVR